MLTSIIEKLPEIISSIAAFAALWFTYNQYTKNKITDYKIESWKKEESQKNIKKAGDIATIYGELWELLHFLKADRVYIIQPHPLYKSLFVSVTLEVKRSDVSSVKPHLTDITISTVAKFTSELANKDYIWIDDVDKEDIDKKMKQLMLYDGCKTLAIRRMTDENDNWIGNLVVSYTRGFNEVDVTKDLVDKMTRSSAQMIQYLLPEYQAPK